MATCRTFGDSGPGPWSQPIAVGVDATTFTLTDLPPGEPSGVNALMQPACQFTSVCTLDASNVDASKCDGATADVLVNTGPRLVHCPMCGADVDVIEIF